MANYDALKTADYSPLLVHLVRNKSFSSSQLIGDSHPLIKHTDSSAKERLINILTTRTIIGSPMPWIPGNPEAACFTECVWRALIRHTDSYSCYGLVFNKRLIFDKGGGPALYVRGDKFNSFVSNLPKEQQFFITPFDPSSALKNGVRIDFLHEREWRLPGSLDFEYSDLEYVIVDSIQDAHDLALAIGEQHIRQNRIIAMESYRIITDAWEQL